jgi:hypothetical protein
LGSDSTSKNIEIEFMNSRCLMKGRYETMAVSSSVIRSPYSSLEIRIPNKPSTSPLATEERP